MEILNIIGAIMTVVMGGLGLLFPSRAASLVGVEAVTTPGRSEFRATYGGMFVAMGVLPLITLSPLFFAFAGLCWAGAAAGRVVSIFVDDANSPANWGAVAFEAAFATSLLLGAPIATLLERLL